MASKKVINVLPYLIVAAFGVVLFLLYKKGIFSKIFGKKTDVDNTTYKESESNVPPPKGSSSGSGSSSGGSTSLNRSLLLKINMYDSPEVAELQRKMNAYAKKKGWPTINVDSDFGPLTEKLLIRITGQPSINLNSLQPYL